MRTVSLKVELESSNEAFQGDNPEEDVAAILFNVAQSIHEGEHGGSVRDRLGNTVGAWALTVSE